MEISTLISKLIKYVLYLAVLYTLFMKSHHKEPFYSLSVENQNKVSEQKNLLKNGILQDQGYSNQYLLTLDHQDVYPAFFGFKWLVKDFKFKQYEKYMFLKGSKLTLLHIQQQKTVVYIDVMNFDYEEKEFSSKENKIFFWQENDLNLQPENAFKCSNEYSHNSNQINFKVEQQNSEDFCEHIITLNDQKFVMKSSQKEEQIFEVNTLDQEKSLFTYTHKLMNTRCNNDMKCLSFYEETKNNQPYNFEGLQIRAFGTQKNSDDLITIFMDEGIQEEEHAKSLQQGFKVGEKVFKLNPVIISYDKLNLNNGFMIKTHSSHLQKENNQTELVMTTLHSHMNNYNRFLLSKQLYQAFVKIDGYVTDNEGKKYEVENLYGVVDLFFYRG